MGFKLCRRRRGISPPRRQRAEPRQAKGGCCRSARGGRMPGGAEAPADGSERSFKVFASTSGIRIAWQPREAGLPALHRAGAREPRGGGSGRRHHTAPSCRVTRRTPAATGGTARKGRAGPPPPSGAAANGGGQALSSKASVAIPTTCLPRTHPHPDFGSLGGGGRKENAATGGGETSL